MSIAVYPIYDDRIDTGFAPVGSIPRHWEIARIRYAAEVSPSRRADGNTDRGNQVVFLPMEAVSDNGKIDQSNRRIAKEVCEGFTYFQRGDVIMAKITPCFENGKGAFLKDLVTDYGFGTTELHVMRPKRVLGAFLYYFVNRRSFRSYSEVFMVGSAGQKRVSTDFLKDQLIPLPPFPEQRAIAAFLDRKCAMIDEAVRIKEEQIKLLRERRQILIQEAVIRGLNPDAPMLDSGIDWIGEVPAHWKVRKIKQIFWHVAEAAEKNNSHELLSIYTDIGVRPRKDLEERGNKASTTDGYWVVQKGDFIVNKLLAWMGAIGLSEYDGVTSPAYDILRPRAVLNGHYFHRLFRSKSFSLEIKRFSRGIMEMRLRIYFDKLGVLEVPFPPKTEQDEIIAYLNEHEQKIEHAISIKQDQIATLKEYKTNLINSAVTGKIKVI